MDIVIGICIGVLVVVHIFAVIGAIDAAKEPGEWSKWQWYFAVVILPFACYLAVLGFIIVIQNSCFQGRTIRKRNKHRKNIGLPKIKYPDTWLKK